MIAVTPSPSKSGQFPSISAELLGRRITCMTNNAVIKAIHGACTEKRKITVSNYNVNSFNLSIQYSWFNDFLQSAEVSHCDGFGIIYALRMMGYKLPLEYRVSYSLLIPNFSHSVHKRAKSYFFGSIICETCSTYSALL